jgi:hypothetical protein
VTHLHEVYKKHGIYDVPDPDLDKPIPEPFRDLVQFEADVAAALILDGKRKQKPVQQPIRTTSGRFVTAGCVCATPMTYNNLMSVVYQDEPHIACGGCGRILDVDHDVFDERIAARIFKITEEFSRPEESFTVDQVDLNFGLHAPIRLRLGHR